MYTAIFTADWHLSNKLPYAKTASGSGDLTDRLLEQMATIRQIISEAKRREVRAVYILGDIFDKRSLDAIVVKAGAQLISEFLSVVPALFIMVGNHDVYSITSDRSVNELFEYVGSGEARYLNPEVTLSFPADNVRFHVLPWCSLDVANVRLERMIQAKNKRKKKMVDVLLLHHSVQGAVDRNWVSSEGLNPDYLDENWDLVLSGHFHDRQPIGKKGHYVSAPMQHDFGDEGEGVRGYSVVTFNNSKYEIEYKNTEYQHFHSLMYSTYLLNLDDSQKGWEENDYVRFDVHTTHAEWKLMKPEVVKTENELRAIGYRVVPARFIPQTQHGDRIELSDDPSTDEILAKYLDVSSFEGLDRSRLLEIAKHALKEVEND